MPNKIWKKLLVELDYKTNSVEEEEEAAAAEK